MPAEAHTAPLSPADPAAVRPRGETAIRVLHSAVLSIILHVVMAAVTVLVVFQLAFSLVTRRAPHPRLAALGGVLSRYTHEVLSYLTHGHQTAPFPFDDLPEERAA